MPAIYGSRAFREYATERIRDADRILLDHRGAGSGLCRCGRSHPCPESVRGQRLRTHYVRLIGEPEAHVSLVRPYVTGSRKDYDE